SSSVTFLCTAPRFEVLAPETRYLGFGEEEGNLALRIVVAVRRVNRVLSLRLGVQLPDRVRSRLGGIRGADGPGHERDGILPLQRHRQTRSTGHEGDQVVVEWASLVHFIEGAGLRRGHPRQAGRANHEALLLEMRDDESRLATRDRVWLEHAEGNG